MQIFFYNGLVQYGGGGGVVICDVVGFVGDFFEQLGVDVFQFVFQFYFFGDGYVVFGDGGVVEFFFDDYVVVMGFQGYFDGVGDGIDVVFQVVVGGFIKYELFSYCDCFLKSEMRKKNRK